MRLETRLLQSSEPVRPSVNRGLVLRSWAGLEAQAAEEVQRPIQHIEAAGS